MNHNIYLSVSNYIVKHMVSIYIRYDQCGPIKDAAGRPAWEQHLANACWQLEFGCQ